MTLATLCAGALDKTRAGRGGIPARVLEDSSKQKSLQNCVMCFNHSFSIWDSAQSKCNSGLCCMSWINEVQRYVNLRTRKPVVRSHCYGVVSKGEGILIMAYDDSARKLTECKRVFVFA